MAQTTTLVLLPQTSFSNTPPPVSGIGSITDNVLSVTSMLTGSAFPIGVGIRGTGVPGGLTIIARGTSLPGIDTYIVSTGGLMVPATTITTIVGVCQSYDVVGSKIAAASYYLGNKSLQTVNINVSDFTGTLIIEGSLYTSPGTSTAEPSNWFPVYTLNASTTADSSTTEFSAANTNTAINITGNYVWMRARIVGFATGTVNWIKLSY